MVASRMVSGGPDVHYQDMRFRLAGLGKDFWQFFTNFFSLLTDHSHYG
jgi:hypothetical protein